MPRIQQLPPSVVTRIAAGEVIERPASVVKELLENAVDAGSTRIDVEVEQGGTELIRVADDGCGIAADDLSLAFANHATSKLANADDLFRVGTLGFRGEALASVGGVAQVTLQSRPADQSCGAEVSCHGGQLSVVKAWNGAPGTRIEVHHLFYNTPVRRKFLRTTATEMGHVAEVFTRLALSHRNLHLTLRHNDRSVHEVSRSTTLLDRIGLFFGAEVRDRLYPIEAKQGPVVLDGYIADPACERGTARTQYLFVNGRWIRDRSLGHALQEAYRGLVMTGRYAVAFLFLQVPPEQVDVNVHPTKAEVRFRDAHALYHLVFATIRERLRAENLTARLRVPSWSDTSVDGAPAAIEPWMLIQPVREQAPLPMAPPRAPVPEPLARDEPAPVANTSNLEGRPSAHGEPLKAIQLYDAYLVIETPAGMLVIDQHALHERILFEQLKSRVREGTLEVQRMLIPEPVELSAEQAARALEQRAALAELGLHVEDFGGGTVILTGYPALLGQRSPQKLLRSVVDYIISRDQAPNREQLLNDLLSLMACHAAVRAGDRLGAEEIAALVAQRDLADDTHHCPHGRPTSLLLSRQELDRQFRRV